MLVTKRDGSIAEFDLDKTREVIAWACSGYDCNPVELEAHIDVIFRDKLTTKHIQSNLITKALQLCSLENSEWRYVAGRLAIMSTWKNNSIPLIEVIDHNYTRVPDSDWFELQEYMQPDRDLLFDYAGATLLKNRYLKDMETPQQMFMTRAMFLGVTLQDKKDIYDALSTLELSLATPLLKNIGVEGGNLSSCFITMAGDNLDSIIDTVNQVAQISKQGGGVGVNMSNVRSKGAPVRTKRGASGGVLPWLNIINATTVAVNQLGSRVGACTVSLDIWHRDIEDFLEMQTETGDNRRKSYDLYPQIVVPDLFMVRAMKNEDWLLVCPHEVKQKLGIDLPKLYGSEFEDAYAAVETSGILTLTTKVRARVLFKHIMRTMFETGMPYWAFKDTINRYNPNSHVGYIPCTNLCVESYSNVSLDCKGQTKESHICNLVSINLAHVTLAKIPKLMRTAVRLLDLAIDYTEPPTEYAATHNKTYRTIGIGSMGLADYLVKNKLNYYTGKAEIEVLYEHICYYAIDASVNLAAEKGSYPKYKGSKWDTGEMLANYRRQSTCPELDWGRLEDKLAVYGIRNSQLTAIAPNTSTALLYGCTPSVLPIFSKFYYENNANGAMPVAPPFIQGNELRYLESKNHRAGSITDVISIIQSWTDTGISYEMIYDLNKEEVTAKYIYDEIMYAWSKGIKAIYYTRFVQQGKREEACSSCTN